MAVLLTPLDFGFILIWFFLKSFLLSKAMSKLSKRSQAQKCGQEAYHV